MSPSGPPPSANLAPAAAASGAITAKSLPSKNNVKRSRRNLYIAGGVVLLTVLGVVTFLLARPRGPRADVILFKVKRELLNVSVTEKGTLESADNKDLTCKVRAGTSKAFATTVNWVIDDGSRVNPGDKLMDLDESALKDNQESQEIVVTKCRGDLVDAEKAQEIVLKDNEINVANAVTALLNAEIALDKLLGMELESTQVPLAAAIGVAASVHENGSYRQSLDDLNGQITQALSDVEQNQERSAWSQRMVKQAYMSPAQAEADRSRLDSSVESLRSLRAKKALLMNYDRRLQIADLTTKRDNARLGLDNAKLKAIASAVQAENKYKTAFAVFSKEYDKLVDIKDQREKCRIKAPLTIRPGSMVVYFKPEGNRFGTSSQALIEQGAQIKEGQKMLRIPNLENMQIATKIHEAVVTRIRGDNRSPTHVYDLFQVGLASTLHPFGSALSTRPVVMDLLPFSTVIDEETEHPSLLQQHEFKLNEVGQRATIRIDSAADRRYVGHVKVVSQVASQNDFMMADVKLYPTIVSVDNELGPEGQLLPVSGEILKPDMTAEVTINVDASKDPVLTIPLQTVIGGAEMGATREVYVKTPSGYERKPVVLGLHNDKMVEVREGLNDGDEVVTNPKVLMDEKKAKTLYGDDQQGGGKGVPGKGGGKEGDPSKKGGKKGGPGGPGGPNGVPGGPKA